MYRERKILNKSIHFKFLSRLDWDDMYFVLASDHSAKRLPKCMAA